MDNTTASPTNMDPRQQTLVFLAGDGTEQIPLGMTDVNDVYFYAFRTAINFGVQVGACLMLLLVLLAMTPRRRYAKWTTCINMAALAVVLVQRLLLVLYFTSSYMDFYTLFTQDPTFLNPVDTGVSIGSSVLAVPQIILIEVALIIQAWAMIQLWPDFWKWLTVGISVVISLLTIGFKCASAAIQIMSIRNFEIQSMLWIQQVDLAFSTTTIFWFCLIFLARLVAHMWKHRSILQSTKGGIAAMDVLVVTNGLLMVVPGMPIVVS